MPKGGPSAAQIRSAMVSSSWVLKPSQTDITATLGTFRRSALSAQRSKVCLKPGLILSKCTLCPFYLLCLCWETPWLSHLCSSPSRRCRLLLVYQPWQSHLLQPPLQHICSKPGWMVALPSILPTSLFIHGHSFWSTTSAVPAMRNKFPLLAGHAGRDSSQQECISWLYFIRHPPLPPGPLQ